MATAVSRKFRFGDMLWQTTVKLARFPAVTSVLVPSLLLSLWAFVQADVVFGEAAPKFERAFVIYFFMGIFLIVFFKKESPLLQIKLWEFALWFSLIFLVTAAVLFFLPWRPPAFVDGAIPGSVLLGFTLFVVAVTEESTFRGTLPDVLTDPRYGDLTPLGAHILSNVIFAIMHYAAYRGSMTAVAFAFFAGMFFSAVRGVGGPKWGMIAAIAMHTAYNARVLTLLGIGGVP